MFPSSFDYYGPETVDEALELLQEHGDSQAELLAGGHSLLPTMKTGLSSPDVLIDVGDIDALTGIETDDDTVLIGALTKYAEVADSDDLWESIPVIAEATESIGDTQVRNRGTVGGNLAHADPASDLPAAVLVSEATIHTHGPDGQREIEASDFFHGVYATALDEEELLTAVEVPTRDTSEVGAYVKRRSPSSGFAIVGVAVHLEVDADTVTSARVAANGAFNHAKRLDPVEEQLVDASLDDELAAEAASHATDDVKEFELMDDNQASSEFRRQLLTVYVREAIETALDRSNREE